MPGWPAAFVPKVHLGMREWNKDGPVAPPIAAAAAQLGPELGLSYEWRGPRLFCVNCPNEL
jgi:hypothetical protein